jgi:hypothetical protein
MRYKLDDLTLEVRSENAAKPTGFRSRFVLDWLTKFGKVGLAVDYGCGRLRYSLPLCSVADRVIAVDSREQLDRFQTINGVRTTIRRYLQRRRKLTALEISDFEKSKCRADLIICINVLSAIPNEEDRVAVVSNVARHLRRSGKCLFAVQHRNSDFNRVRRIGRAKAYKDGYLIDMGGWSSFYGLLNRQYIVKLLEQVGLVTDSAFIEGQSTYVVARHGVKKRLRRRPKACRTSIWSFKER